MSVTINDFPFDVAVSLRYTQKSDVTKKPVEKGSNIADSIRPNEPVLELEVVVSDTPIGAVASHSSRVGNPSAADTAFQRLIDLQGQELTVECSLGTFDEMAISNISIARDVKTRKALKATVTLEHIRIEDTTRATVASVPSGTENFGLNVDKVFNGDKILWRKGDPPGSFPPPFGDGRPFKGTEVIQSRKNRGLYHLSGVILTSEESDDFLKDLARDSFIMQNRAIGRAQLKNAEAGRRIDRMQAILDQKNQQAHPGQHTDRAVLGKKR